MSSFPISSLLNDSGKGGGRKTSADFISDFVKLVSSNSDPALWNPIYTSRKQEMIRVCSHRTLPNCYLIEAILENSVEACFDCLVDAETVKLTDEMIVELRDLAYGTTSTDGNQKDSNDVFLFQASYIRIKGVWPMAPRHDALLNAVGRLSDGRYAIISQSIADPDMLKEHVPELASLIAKSDLVRMQCGLSGTLLQRVDSPATRPKCKITRVLNVDLKGWVPAAVISFITSKAIPSSVKKLNRVVRELEPVSKSACMTKIQRKRTVSSAVQPPLTPLSLISLSPLSPIGEEKSNLPLSEEKANLPLSPGRKISSILSPFAAIFGGGEASTEQSNLLEERVSIALRDMEERLDRLEGENKRLASLLNEDREERRKASSSVWWMVFNFIIILALSISLTSYYFITVINYDLYYFK